MSSSPNSLPFNSSNELILITIKHKIMLVLTKSGFVVISILLASKLTWILIRFEIRMNNELRIYLFEKFLKGFSIFGICNLSKTLILVECNPLRWARVAGGWIWMIVGWVLGGLWERHSSGCEWNRSKYLIVILITPDTPPNRKSTFELWFNAGGKDEVFHHTINNRGDAKWRTLED